MSDEHKATVGGQNLGEVYKLADDFLFKKVAVVLFVAAISALVWRVPPTWCQSVDLPVPSSAERNGFAYLFAFCLAAILFRVGFFVINWIVTMHRRREMRNALLLIEDRFCKSCLSSFLPLGRRTHESPDDYPCIRQLCELGIITQGKPAPSGLLYVYEYTMSEEIWRLIHGDEELRGHITEWGRFYRY